MKEIPLWVLSKCIRKLPDVRGPELHVDVEYETENGLSVLRFKKVTVYPGVQDWALQFR